MDYLRQECAKKIMVKSQLSSTDYSETWITRNQLMLCMKAVSGPIAAIETQSLLIKLFNPVRRGVGVDAAAGSAARRPVEIAISQFEDLDERPLISRGLSAQRICSGNLLSNFEDNKS
ncbi:hypothetical protein EVAR_17480_1 [Eumeta japonica]|uniref:Uncharacterized protein n=1 Tax=Eumeta variegata TaxID=151549 RepID=A0A4C1ZLB6_EUMVA|nr:hypothetical protein EVAR_17480_1 [Eumeta japonica]